MPAALLWPLSQNPQEPRLHGNFDTWVAWLTAAAAAVRCLLGRCWKSLFSGEWVPGCHLPGDESPGCQELPFPRQGPRQRRELEARALHLVAQSLGYSFALDKLSWPQVHVRFLGPVWPIACVCFYSLVPGPPYCACPGDLVGEGKVLVRAQSYLWTSLPHQATHQVPSLD